MPLRCFDPIACKSVHAFELSSGDWLSLEIKNRRERHLRMPCCSSLVILRRSRRGTQFFAHKTVTSCVTAPESEAHLRLKRIAAEVARAHGWDAETEVAGVTPLGERWKADVLARRGKAQVAVEIQWSLQTNEETLRRQERYAASGVRCLWLLRQRRFPIDPSLPAARIGGSLDNGFTASVPTGFEDQILPLEDFLGAAFSKRLRFGIPNGMKARIGVRAGKMSCWSCGSDTRIITGVFLFVGPHEFKFSIPDLGEYPDACDQVLRRLPENLGIGRIKRRFSRTQKRAYLSNGCAHCDAIVGEFHEHDAWPDQEVYETFTQIDDGWLRALNDEASDLGWAVYPR